MAENHRRDRGRDGAPSFKRHPHATRRGGKRTSGGRAVSGYRGGEYLTEDEWRARRQPESVQGIVDRLMDKVGGGRAAPAALLSARWSEVVGEQFAAKTRPGSCENGRLTVLVADGATASKMRFLTSQILQRAAQIVEAETVTSISFRVTPGLVR